MDKNEVLSSEEIKSPVTGDIESKKTGTTVEDLDEKDSFKDNAQGKQSLPQETPESISRTKYFEQERLTEIAKEKFWKRLTTVGTILGWLIGVVIVFLAIFYAYGISNIAEPIGGIKQEMKNIDISNSKLEERLNVIEKNLQSTREEFIKQKKIKRNSVILVLR